MTAKQSQGQRRHGLSALSCAAVLALACAVPVPAQAEVGAVAAALGSEGVSTPQIFNTTVGAAMSCMRWRVRGSCIWLRCSFFGCWVESTIRVEHYTPDVTISTWHDAASHPWRDYGRVVAGRLGNVGGLMVGLPRLDSAGSDGEAHGSQYRGADAFGNPANILQGAVSGNFGNPLAIGTSIVVPNSAELVAFFSSFPAQVAGQWATVPASYTAQQRATAQQSASMWSQLMGVAGNVGAVANQVVGVVNNARQAITVAGQLSNITNGGQAAQAGGGAGGGGGGGGAQGAFLPGGTFVCPPAISPFEMAFQSDMDAPFWRGVLPLESVFPAPWLPGMREVGAGLAQTWGSVWPRQGMLYQTHPVKASAVIATRVGDIISNRAQPHIYRPLNTHPNGFRFFGEQGISERFAQTRWQRVFPNPQTSCGAFGTNDTLQLSSYGDGQNAAGQGAIWNAWRRQECCQNPGGSFLYSIEL